MQSISGLNRTLQLGKQSAWACFILFVIYDIDVLTGGVIKGVFNEPNLTIAEIFSILGACILIVLMATIHECAAQEKKIFSLIAFGWTILLAGFTIAVHFVNLTLLKQLNPDQKTKMIEIVGWAWPSIFYAIELAAWHLLFGLSLVFASVVFQGSGHEKIVRAGLLVTGFLCILGLAGPLTGNLSYRLTGMFAYGFIFPFICIFIALVFKKAQNEIR